MKMKTIESLRDYLLENHVDEEGDLMLSDLDFSNFDGDVYTCDMRVKGNLHQDDHEVQGNLYQGGHEVQGYLKQSGHKVQGSLYQSFHEVQGNYYCQNVEFKGNIFTNEPTKLLQEITLAELAEMGYKLKGGN